MGSTPITRSIAGVRFFTLLRFFIKSATTAFALNGIPGQPSANLPDLSENRHIQSFEDHLSRSIRTQRHKSFHHAAAAFSPHRCCEGRRFDSVQIRPACWPFTKHAVVLMQQHPKPPCFFDFVRHAFSCRHLNRCTSNARHTVIVSYSLFQFSTFFINVGLSNILDSELIG